MQVKDRTLLGPCSMLQLRSGLCHPRGSTEVCLSEGHPEMRAMASNHIPRIFNLPSLLPTTLANPLSLLMISGLNYVSCSLACISPCSSLPCLQASLFIVLFLTSSIPPKVMLNTTHPLSPGLLIQVVPPTMLLYSVLSKCHSTAHPSLQTPYFTIHLTGPISATQTIHILS